jgi:hypothetical protein
MSGHRENPAESFSKNSVGIVDIMLWPFQVVENAFDMVGSYFAKQALNDPIFSKISLEEKKRLRGLVNHFDS